MPLYEYSCERCQATETAFRHVEQRHDAPTHCNKPMQKLITPAMVRPEIAAFQSPIDGRPINSRKQWREDLKRNQCRPWEGMSAEKKHAASIQQSQDAKFEKRMREATADTLSHMSRSKQEALKRVRV